MAFEVFQLASLLEVPIVTFSCRLLATIRGKLIDQRYANTYKQANAMAIWCESKGCGFESRCQKKEVLRWTKCAWGRNGVGKAEHGDNNSPDIARMGF